MTINKSHIFVLLLVLLAFAVTLISYRQIPHSLVMHVNDRWHIMLVGESNTNKLDYHASDFVMQDYNQANIWLHGHGPIQWRQNHISVQDDAIIINNKSISTTHADSEAHLTLYPDGRISKGELQLHQ